VPLGASQVASASSHTFSGLLGTVTVTDDRGGTHAWVASVISTAFAGDAGQTAVPALNVHYSGGHDHGVRRRCDDALSRRI